MVSDDFQSNLDPGDWTCGVCAQIDPTALPFSKHFAAVRALANGPATDYHKGVNIVVSLPNLGVRLSSELEPIAHRRHQIIRVALAKILLSSHSTLTFHA